MKPLLVVAAAALVLLGAMTIRAARTARGALPVTGDEALVRPELAAARLAWVAAAAVPVLWFALRAEVAAWPGLSCVLGVTRLGTRAGGVAAALPWLLGAAAVSLAGVLLATGAWATLRRIDRATVAAPLARRALAWMTVAGALAICDGAAAAGWALVPRDAPDVEAGCCTTRLASDAAPLGLHSAGERNLWAAAFVVTGGSATAALAVASRRGGRLAPAALAVSGVAAFVAARFADVSLAPARLGLPLHECAWCLLDRAPENWIGVVATAGGVACAAWACLSLHAGRTTGAAQAATAEAQRLLGIGAACFAVATTLGASGRWLA